LIVVAWSRRSVDGAGQWLRWQSPPVVTRGELQNAWSSAAQWAQNPSDADKRYEVAVAALDEWKVFYYRGDAWTNPLSSDSAAPPVASAKPTGVDVNLPDGIRLVLSLPPGEAIGGTLTRDWVRLGLGGGKS
jgi:general secretion pathway protein J